MVQILPEAPGFGAQFARQFGGGIGQGVSSALDQRDKMRMMQEKANLAQKQDQYKFSQQFEADQKNYQTMEQTFGKKFADTWLASGQGERTELTKAGLEAKRRGLDIDKLLGNEPKSKEKTSAQEGELPDYELDTSGMTPQEKVTFKGALRKENTPIWQESKNRQKSYHELDRDINILDSLNEKKNLPEGFAKLLINPETGAPYDIATAVKDMHPDVQRWVKTIARQATQAQSAFPGRVTNFDLTQYMRQFPSLFNTFDGRKIILQQMKLTNKANKLMEDALDKVYAKYKLSGITPEDAQSLAEKMVGSKIQEIDQQLLQLGEEGEMIASPAQSQSGRVPVFDANGNEVGDIDMSEIDQLPEGFRIK